MLVASKADYSVPGLSSARRLRRLGEVRNSVTGTWPYYLSFRPSIAIDLGAFSSVVKASTGQFSSGQKADR